MSKARFAPVALIAALSFFPVATSPAVAETQPPACPQDPTESAALFTPEPVPLSGWVFEGCWTFWAAGPCRDVYRDSSGGYWLCGDCGATQNPSPVNCSRISIQTLNVGYWCS